MKDADKTIEQLEAEIVSLEEKREELFTQREPIDKAIQSAYNRIEWLTEILDEKKIEGGLSWDEVVEHVGGMPRYYESERLLSEIGLRHSGIITKTGQRCIQFSIGAKATDEEVKKVKDGIILILQYLKPFEIEDVTENGIYFDVMEYTLSEGGIYFVVRDFEDNKWKLCKTTYGRTKVKKEFDNLDDLLALIKERHPYPGREDYDDYDDY